VKCDESKIRVQGIYGGYTQITYLIFACAVIGGGSVATQTPLESGGVEGKKWK